jgi:hypothetical protein
LIKTVKRQVNARHHPNNEGTDSSMSKKKLSLREIMIRRYTLLSISFIRAIVF